MSSGSVRGQRYCEIIVYHGFQNPAGDVFSTWGLTDCPTPCWDSVTQAEVIQDAEAMGITQVRGANLNGPRYWVMDGVTGLNPDERGATGIFGGCLLTEQIASLPITSQEIANGGTPPYQDQTINRSTKYTYNKGEQMFVLTNNNNGQQYVMQSYTTLVDSNLTLGQLPTLGTSGLLTLPSGWSYEVVTCHDSDYTLETNNNEAIVVQDNLKNSYQNVNNSISNFNLNTCTSSNDTDTSNTWWWWILFIILIIIFLILVFVVYRNAYV